MTYNCNNKLQIYCDNKQILDKIHELFYYQKYDSIPYFWEGFIPQSMLYYSYYGIPYAFFNTPLGYWGTRLNFNWTKIKHRKDKITVKYGTPNNPDHFWIFTLIVTIEDLINNFTGDTKPRILVKNSWDECKNWGDGYLHWETGKDLFYEYSDKENICEIIINEFRAVGEELYNEHEQYIEYYLEGDEPYIDEFEYRFQRYGWNMFYID